MFTNPSVDLTGHLLAARWRPLLLTLATASMAAVIASAACLDGTAAEATTQGVTGAAVGGPPAILLSRQLVEAERLSVGDVVYLSADPSGASPQPFRLAGIYEPTPDPLRVMSTRLEARLHLPDLIALTADSADPLAAETVSTINVALQDPTEVQAFARTLSAKVPGLIILPTARPAEPTGPFAVIERFHLAIAIVTMVGSTMFLLALMVMHADERRETVGILRLIGVPKRRVLIEVFAEGLLIALAGAVFGILLAVVSQGLFNRFFQWRYDTGLVFVRITPWVVWRSLLLAVPLGIGASLVASWALLRRDILTLVSR